MEIEYKNKEIINKIIEERENSITKFQIGLFITEMIILIYWCWFI